MSTLEMTPVKRALLEIRDLRSRLADLESASREPIAIVGIGIRAPGQVYDLAGFAELLWAGRHGISPIPATRWPIDAWYDADRDAPGKMMTRYGGFIDDIDQFDAEFFGISPREASSMDPQQRLVLELAWNALEDFGHAPAQLAGTKAGVYLGVANGDYGRALFAKPRLIDAYFSSGNAHSVAAGRVSYLLGFQGPAIAVDTACSSSLAALHLACQGLRQGECDLALAGGVNLILTPEMNINFSKAGMMAPDGRCKTFDAAADGYVRGEGGAIVVLRRLRDAQSDGDRILALIRGSALNQDGRSNGLTAPNGPAQEGVIRAALKNAHLTPQDVGYIEAHGTGTSLGDPIEVNALASVFGERNESAPVLAIGSVKTNIGHLEAAAGIVGLAKAVLALQRGEIPPHLNLNHPNSHVAWDSIPMVVPTVVTPWGSNGVPRVAGVSSFGFSGTNAHVVLEQAPAEVRPAANGPQRDLHVLAISARDVAALDVLVAAYVHLLRAVTDAVDLADLCFTANAGRAHFAHRVSVIGDSGPGMAAALQAFQSGDSHPDIVSGVVGEAAPRVAMLFPGQGSQYVGMGRALYDGAPAFRETFDRCADVLDQELPQPIRSVLFAPGTDAALLDETAFAQPAIFALEVALASLWKSWGIHPVAVMGHSFGEYAAAYVAGALPLGDGARMITARGRLVQALPRDGAMTVIGASERAVHAKLGKHREQAAIAAVNGPANTVISGERAAVDALAGEFAAAGARVTPLRISHAFHSPLVDSVLDEFEREVSRVEFSEPQITLISNLSGQVADLALIGRATYWRRHMRESVRFGDSMRTLAAQGITHYIEIGPHPVLIGMGSDCVEGGAWLPSLREGKAAWPEMLHALQVLYCAGAPVDWQGFDRGMGRRRRPALPSYPFQRKRHWIDGIGAFAPAADNLDQHRWQRMQQALDRQAERGPLDLNVASYPQKWDCLARINRGHAIQVLRDARLFTKPFDRHSLDQVMAQAGISAAYRHLVGQWLKRLSHVGLIRAEADSYVADSPLPDPTLPALWREAETLFGDNQPLLAYVRQCGKLLTAVLTGKESPLETLFPGGSFELAEGLYQRSATMRYINGLAAAAIETFSEQTAPGVSFRVMEVGAGTGGTTSSLLPVLPPDRARYRFTDMSTTFFDQARKRFASHRFVEYGLFDMEMPPGEQGYAAQSFDLIVSANAVHASTDLRVALRHLRSLLAPGGFLLLVESTTNHEWFDMTTGLIEGWKHFADDLRTDSPLLSPAEWMAALREEGFADTAAWPPRGSPAEAMGQHVIVAHTAGAWQASQAAHVGGNGGHEIPEPAARPWRELLESALSGERLTVLQEIVCGQVMQVLGADTASQPARHDRLMEIGMDSLMAVQLRNSLTKALALDPPLPSTLIFDYPTINAIAEYLLERVKPPGDRGLPKESEHLHTPAIRDAEAIAAMSDEDIAKVLFERAENS